MAKVNWEGMDSAILKAIEDLRSKGYTHPTVRSVYYVLGSMNVIPLTHNGYKSLDAKVVKMRKEGAIPWGFFAVKRGTSDEAGVPVPLPHGLQVNIDYTTAQEWADYWVLQAKDAHETFMLPRWFEQENLVEVWVEKDGLLGATSSWLAEKEVTIRAPQGYGAWEFVHDSMRKIRRELKRQNKKRVHILYLGDLDPSGKDIPRFMSEDAIAHFTAGLDLTFKEIALSPEQVREFGLPEEPESSEVLEKIHRDSRLVWYREHYPPDMFVELDALYALATDAAQELLNREVDSFFDESVFLESREIEKSMKKDVKRRVRSAISFPDE